ncbi:MAG: MFS transporter [Candidatus Eremiobacterota bacterium]
MGERVGRGYSLDFWKANLMNLLTMTGQAVFFLLTLYFLNNGLDRREVGVCDGTFWLVSVLIQPWLGRQLDRVGRKPFFVYGTVLMAVASVGYLTLPTHLLLMIPLRALHGVGFSCFFTASWTWVSDQAPPHRMAEMLGVFGVSGLLAGAMGPVLGEQLKERYSFVLAFQVALALILAGSLMAAWVHEAPFQQTKAQRRGIGFFKLAATLRMRGLTLASLAMGITIGSVFAFVAPYVAEKHIHGVGYIFVLYTVAAVATRLFAGQVTGRLGAVGVISLALGMNAVALVAFRHLTTSGWTGLPLMLGTGAGAGLAYGLIYPALGALAVERSGTQRGVGMSVVACFGDLGSSLGAAAAGVVAHYLDYARMWFCVGIVVAGIALLFLLMEAQWRARRRRRPKESEGPPLRLVPRENRLG